MLRVAMDVRCLVEGELRGFSRYSDELIAALHARGEVDLVGITDRPIDRQLGFPVHVASPGREWAVEQLGFARLARQLDADVFFCPTNRGLPLVGVPSVLTLHDAVEWDRELVHRPVGRSRVRFSYSTAASLAGATRIITVSDHAAGEITRRLGIDRARMDVISEAPAARFRRLPTEADLRTVKQMFGLPPAFGLYVGGFDTKKSVDTLVRAWALLDPATRPPLLLAGKRTDESSALLALAERLGVGDDVRMLGYVDDELLPALYRAATVFVFPAVAEGFGLPALEAMASGTPTVVADAGALPEVVQSAALRFTARDHAALAGIVARVLADPGERVRLGTVARTHALLRSWDDVAAETAEVLHRAAGVGPLRRIGESVGSLRSLARWMT